MFIYATSQQSDHAFYMFQDNLVLALIQYLHTNIFDNTCSILNISKTCKKILWILINYTSYNPDIGEEYMELIIRIWYESTSESALKLNSSI